MTPGTVSIGNSEPASVAIRLLDALQQHDSHAHWSFLGDDDATGALSAARETALQAVNGDIGELSDLESVSVEYLLTALVELFGKYAPDDHYFCAHPGDPTDLGFWPESMFN